MTTKTLPVFRQTLEKTELWLDEIMEQLDWDDRQQAYKALRCVLQTLRDRLTIEEATDLASQMPMLIRGLFFEGWNPGRKPIHMKTAEEFVNAVNENFPPPELAGYVESKDITRAVLRVLASHTSPGEIDDVIHSLPKRLQELWD